MNKINKKDYGSWKEYYFEYQYQLAKQYYIPYLKRIYSKYPFFYGTLKNKKIIDVGCGNGGFISAFEDISDNLTGIEIKKFDWPKNSNVEFIIGDLVKLTSNLPQLPHGLVDSKWPKGVRENLQIDYDYNLIILRDVVEHIPLDEKMKFFRSLKKILHPDSKNNLIMVTFPPFYSPFGLHQQVFCNSILKYVPYLSLLPVKILKFALKLFGENEDTFKKLLEIRNCRMTIRGFIRMVSKLGLQEIDSDRLFFTVRPSHQLRYGFKTRKSYLTHIPYLRELFVTGTVFVLKLSQPYDNSKGKDEVLHNPEDPDINIYKK